MLRISYGLACHVVTNSWFPSKLYIGPFSEPNNNSLVTRLKKKMMSFKNIYLNWDFFGIKLCSVISHFSCPGFFNICLNNAQYVREDTSDTSASWPF